MRQLIVVVLLLWHTLLAQAQIVGTSAPLISPLGIALTVGQWMYNGSEKIYYIEVAGEGSTIEESKLNGFRLAVEQAVGSIIASETESNNNRITRDEIISYASGYVNKFEIVSQSKSPNGYKTIMKVWIKRSTIANRLLHTSQAPQEINGDKASVSLSSLQYERKQGDRLVNAVVNDFYRMGMNIQTKPPTVVFDDSRNGVLVVPYVLTWNENYLESLWQSLKATSQEKQDEVCVNGTCSSTSYISMPKSFKFGRTLKFSDSYKIDKIISVMVGTKPTILMTIHTLDNKVLYLGCYNLDELDHSSGFDVQGAEYFVDSKFFGPKNLVFNSDLKVEKKITLTVSSKQLQMANRLNLRVVPRNQCPR